MTKLSPFHLAIPVKDLSESKNFYKNILGCKPGRESDEWADYDFFGHQLVIHYKEQSHTQSSTSNPVDGKDVPIPHFGVVLDWDVFQEFSKDLKNKSVNFVIEPYIRFEGKTGEQATMFFYDPCGNALEFKAFKDMSQLFAS